MRIVSPIPESAIDEAGRLWWHHFGRTVAPILRRTPPRVDRRHGIALISPDGRVAGVIGLRDSQGGFVRPRRSVLAPLYRPAPATADLVIDGIAVSQMRCGHGARLIAAARRTARETGRPGLRAEVAGGNRRALAFYRAQGFTEIARGHFGWPWTGMVIVLRAPA